MARLMPAEEVLREANARFYEALSALDLDAMERLWLHAAHVRCVHPGWELLIGWAAVRASWEGIFENAERLAVEAGDVQVRVEGSLGWVGCVERISTREGVSFTAATNLFQRTDDGWRMVLHHASMIPVPEIAPAVGPVH